MLEITTHTPPDADGWEVKHLHITDQSLDLVEVTMGGEPVELTIHEALSLVQAVTSAAMGALGYPPLPRARLSINVHTRFPIIGP